MSIEVYRTITEQDEKIKALQKQITELTQRLESLARCNTAFGHHVYCGH